MKKILFFALIAIGLMSCTGFNGQKIGIDINNGMLIPYFITYEEAKCFSDGDTIVLQYNDIGNEYRVAALYKNGINYKDDCFIVIYQDNE